VSNEEKSIALDVAENRLASLGAASGRVWTLVESVLERLGDRLNPILVKETRQALKSRQFLLTFMLLLFLGWGWSILGIAQIGPAAAFGSHGSEMLLGYLVILAFPLMVVVPFGTFRSLAAEQESHTYELLAITALGSRQIVAGKLGSAVLQMAIYLSAVSPCLCFTYLLRGIDFFTIILILFWLSAASLGCSVVGILLATITSHKQFQVIPMVAAVVGFLFCFIMTVSAVVSFLTEGGTALYTESGFWIANAALLAAFVAYFALLCEASAARLSFASDNRSTRLRIIMLAHYLLFIGWMAACWMLIPEPSRVHTAVDYSLSFMSLVCVHWYVMGAFMVGESPRLSSRVKRQLPRSFLGRVFLTWFYPGPGTGYVLAISGIICGLLTTGVFLVLAQKMGNFPPNRYSAVVYIAAFSVLGSSYVVVYLGLGLLLIRLFRRFTSAGLVLSVLLQVFLLLLGCAAPLVIQWSFLSLRYAGYSLLHITNPFWTLIEAGNMSSLTVLDAALVLVPLAAVAVFCLNLPGLLREIRIVRIIKPQRVVEDDADLSNRA
jgi:hypothetical protein